MILNGNRTGLLLGKPMIGYLGTGCLATNGGCKWSGDRALVEHMLYTVWNQQLHCACVCFPCGTAHGVGGGAVAPYWPAMAVLSEWAAAAACLNGWCSVCSCVAAEEWL